MGVVQSSIGGGTTEAAAVGAAFIAGTATAYTVYKQRFAASTTSTEKNTNAPREKTTATASRTKKNNTKSKKGGDGEDAELDALLARAKAEKEEEARLLEKASYSKGVIPGSFELDGVEVSSEVEGREKKARRKGKKKGASVAASSVAAASTTIGEASGAASTTGGGGGEDVSKKTAPASTNKLVDSPVQPNVPTSTAEPTAGSPKKQKKRKAAKAADNTIVIPSGSTRAAPGSTNQASKLAGTAPSLQSSQALGMSLRMSDAPDDASWTRVSTRKKHINDNQTQQAVRRETSQTDPELFTSDTNITTSGVTDQDDEGTEEEEDKEGSVREPEHRRTFAERMLPKPRKTGVEDMEDEPLQPTLSRVMRITPKPGEKPAKGFSWADYEEYAGADGGTSADGDEDDAWEEVKSKKKKLDRSSSGLTSSIDSLSLSQLQTQTQAASAKQTKRQRQNAKQKESKQLEKQTQDQEQRDRLAKHQRELERERIKEQYANSGGGGSGKKNVSGGMKASVEGGKLVWD